MQRCSRNNSIFCLGFQSQSYRICWRWEERLHWIISYRYIFKFRSWWKLTAQILLRFCCSDLDDQVRSRLKCFMIEHSADYINQKINPSNMVLKLSHLDRTMFKANICIKSTKWIEVCKYNLSQSLGLKSTLNVAMSLEKEFYNIYILY